MLHGSVGICKGCLHLVVWVLTLQPVHTTANHRFFVTCSGATDAMHAGFAPQLAL